MTTPTADRLSIGWVRLTPSVLVCTIDETRAGRRAPARTVRTVYLVEPQADGSYTFAKSADHEGPRADEVYTVRLFEGGSTCDCKGSTCRQHELVCRHRLAVLNLRYGDPAQTTAEVPDHPFPSADELLGRPTPEVTSGL